MQYVTLASLAEGARLHFDSLFPAVSRAPGAAPSRLPSARRQVVAAIRWVLPPTEWLPAYRPREDLRRDMVGGLVMGVMFIPMGLAYAALLSVPMSVGLYSAGVYSLFYSIFGGVAALSMGPVAEVTLLLLGTPGAPASPEDTQHPEAAAALQARASFFQGIAVQVAILTFAMCLVRGGAIIRNSFARAVGDAYSAAAGIILITSQLKAPLNVKTRASIRLHEIVADLAEATIATATINSLYSVLIFAAFVAYLIIVKRVRAVPSWIPHQLIVLVVGIAGTWGLRLDRRINLHIVGRIEARPPEFSLPDVSNFGDTLLSAFIVSLVSFLQLYSIASRFAPTLDANHELFANGLCALAAGFTGGIPGSSSFSRCSVLGDLDVRTPLNSFLAATVVFASALFLIRLGVFFYLPSVALAAIICASVVKLVNFSHAYWLLRIFPLDFVVWTTTFLVTLFFGVAPGILSGIGLSTVIVLFRVGRPPTSTLGYDPQRRQWRELDDEELLLNPHVLVWSFNAPLYFVNVSFFSTLLGEAITAAGRPLSVVVVNFSRVTSIDASSVQALTTQLRSVQQRHGVRVFLAAVHPIVEEALLRAPTETRIEWLVNDDAIFVSVDAAVAHAEAYVQHKRHLLAPHPQVPAAAFGLRSGAGGPQRSAASVLLGGAARREDRRLLGVIGVVSHADRTPKQKLKCTIDDESSVREIFALAASDAASTVVTLVAAEERDGAPVQPASSDGTPPLTPPMTAALPMGPSPLLPKVVKPKPGSPTYEAVLRALRVVSADDPASTEAHMERLLTMCIGGARKGAPPLLPPSPGRPEGAGQQPAPDKPQLEEEAAGTSNDRAQPANPLSNIVGASATDIHLPEMSTQQPSRVAQVADAVHPKLVVKLRVLGGGALTRLSALVVLKWGGRQTPTGRRQAHHFGSTLATRIGLDQDTSRFRLAAVSNGEERVDETGGVVLDALCDALGLQRDAVPLLRDKSLDETSDAARVFVAECEHRVTQLFRPLPPAALRRKWHITGVSDLSIAHGIPTPYHAACLLAVRVADLVVALGNEAVATVEMFNGETAAMARRRYQLALTQFDPDADLDELLAAVEGVSSPKPQYGAAKVSPRVQHASPPGETGRSIATILAECGADSHPHAFLLPAAQSPTESAHSGTSRGSRFASRGAQGRASSAASSSAGESQASLPPCKKGESASAASRRATVHPAVQEYVTVCLSANGQSVGRALFADERVHRFDTTKVKPLYDHVTFDVIHNAATLTAVGVDLRPVFALVQALYVIVSGSRFGADPSEKFISGALMAATFLRLLQSSVQKVLAAPPRRASVPVSDRAENARPPPNLSTGTRHVGDDAESLPVNLFFTSVGLVSAMRNCLTHSASLNALLVDEGARQTLQRMELGGWHYMTHLVLKVFRVMRRGPATATLPKHDNLVNPGSDSVRQLGVSLDEACGSSLSLDTKSTGDVVVEVYLSAGASIEATAVANLNPSDSGAGRPDEGEKPTLLPVHLYQAAQRLTEVQPMVRVWTLRLDSLDEFIREVESEGESQKTLIEGC